MATVENCWNENSKYSTEYINEFLKCVRYHFNDDSISEETKFMEKFVQALFFIVNKTETKNDTEWISPSKMDSATNWTNSKNAIKSDYKRSKKHSCPLPFQYKQKVIPIHNLNCVQCFGV